jgi:uncharacterized protein (TIGR03083 family)
MSPVVSGRTVLSADECIDLLRREGERLGEVAAGVPLDARVPGCPDWDVDKLIRHMGDVHRWAATIVRDRLKDRLRRDFAGPSDRAALLAWYREGHAQLVGALASASPDDAFWMWGEAPNAMAFWARRQAHETAIHRLDVEQAAGTDTTPFTAPAAADGIDEWLNLAARRARVPDGGGRSLSIAPLDAPDRWLVGLRDDGLSVERVATGGDCEVRAPANDLFALLMNRRDSDGVEVDGDAGVLRAWREHVRFV